MTTGLSASGRSSMDWRISLSVLLLAVLQASLAFNIDPAAWKSLSDPADGFGYKVVQRTKDNLLISAPLQDYGGQKRGGIYQCTVGTSSCTLLAVPVPNEAVNMSLGLTMTKHPVKSDTLVCGPTIPRDCKSITTYNGMCLEINSRNHVGLPVPASLDRCPVNADICFLLDGSGSVSSDDFERMKSFVNSLIEDLVGRGSQFAVVQYSYRTEIHFDFKAFSDNGWKEKVEAISRLRGGTKTAAGIKEVVNNVFSTNGGSRPDVKKILIVITDGQSQDGIYLPSAASDADKKSIVRFAIGVGDAFSDQRAKAELYQIASDNRVLQVNNFEELGGKIRDELQESIFSIEGSQVGGETLEMEMAQQGFSAAYLPQGGFQMGTVGAFQWNGGYHKYSRSSEKPTFYKPSNTEADGYLGYSMAVAETRTHTFTIVGAPRFQHTGRVFVFSSDIPDQIIDDPSHQIGIYFGAEVCAIDVGGNSDTDLVLLSAPMYAERDREGRVYVCLLRRRGVQCSPGDTGMMMTLLGKTGERGRFGTSLAPLPDLNADGLNDLAVGAPLENDGQGSIYIFNGERGKISNVYSIKEGYSQRIPGSAVQDGLRFFGLSISQSSLDLSGDGLPDLAVGSNGAVLLLRSKPIVRVEPEVSFSPNKIPTNHTDCKIPLRNTATICFTMISNTSAQAEINYTLTLDSTRPVHFIAYIQPEQQEVTNSITLRGRQCVSHLFFIEACPDGFIPLSNRLSFTFKGLPSENDLSPSLAQNPKTPSYYPLGFEICGRDNKCIDNLKVDFNFTDTSELRVGIQDVLNVTVTVDSREDNSYNSRVIVTYPAEMSYKTVTMVKGRVECSPLDSEDRVTPGTADCTIDKPLFKGKERAVFIISFHVDINSQFGQMVTFTANATSGSNHSAGSELFQRREIGVKYSIYVLISRVEDSTSYTNFSAGKNYLQKPVRQSMKVVNFDRDVNLTVIVKVPMWLGDKDIWVNPSGMQIPGCRRGSDEEPTVKDFVEKLKRKQPLDCSVARCGVFLCNHVVSKEDNNFYIHISGNLSSGWIEQIGLTSALFDLVSTATLNYDITKYIYFSTNSQNNPPVLKIGTTVEVYAEVDLTKEIIGSTLGGLALLALITAGLYKAGFFKSNVKQMMNNASNSAPQPDNEGVEAPQELT